MSSTLQVFWNIFLIMYLTQKALVVSLSYWCNIMTIVSGLRTRLICKCSIDWKKKNQTDLDELFKSFAACLFVWMKHINCLTRCLSQLQLQSQFLNIYFFKYGFKLFGYSWRKMELPKMKYIVVFISSF